MAATQSHSPSDLADLLARAGQGDRQAFATLYQATSAKLFGLTLRILVRRDLAEEALQDAFGKVTRVQGAFQDITVLKKAEASLAESERRFREMADTFPFFVWTADPDGLVDYSNRTMASYIRPDQDKPSGDKWIDYVHPDDVPNCQHAWKTSVRTGETYLVDYRLKEAASGNYRWHRVRAEPTRDAAGQIVKWYGTGIDIDGSKSLEQKAKSLASRLNNSLESMTSGFIILDRAWTFIHVNTPAARLVGRERENLLGKNIWTEFPQIAGTSLEEIYLQAVRDRVPVHLKEQILTSPVFPSGTLTVIGIDRSTP